MIDWNMLLGLPGIMASVGWIERISSSKLDPGLVSWYSVEGIRSSSRLRRVLRDFLPGESCMAVLKNYFDENICVSELFQTKMRNKISLN